MCFHLICFFNVYVCTCMCRLYVLGILPLITVPFQYHAMEMLKKNTITLKLFLSTVLEGMAERGGEVRAVCGLSAGCFLKCILPRKRD